MIAILPARPGQMDQGNHGGEAGARPIAFLAGYGPGSSSLVSALGEAGFLAIAYDEYLAALHDAARLRPELTLVGDSDSAGGPFQFLVDLQGEGVDGVVLFLSRSGDPEKVSQALEAGAHDVLSPPHSVSAILMRRHVHEKRRRMPRPFARSPLTRQVSMAGLTVDLATREVSDGTQPFTLSGRELELLVRLMEARGDVVPRERLMADIWGDAHGSEAVLDATVHRLRKKLDEQMDRPDLVGTVRGVGYRLQAV